MLLNETKIILDLCGGTGAWSKPYRDAGYDVKLITLPEHDVTNFISPKQVYGILAAPPCTEFSLAWNRWPNIKRDFIKGMTPVNACIRIIWQTKPIFWALENPVGLLSRFLGEYKYRFEPWWFGEPWSKKTALWGKFNKPRRKYNKWEDVPNKNVKDFVSGASCYVRRKIPSISDFTTGAQSKLRSITPGGFAQAFFEANP